MSPYSLGQPPMQTADVNSLMDRFLIIVKHLQIVHKHLKSPSQREADTLTPVASGKILWISNKFCPHGEAFGETRRTQATLVVHKCLKPVVKMWVRRVSPNASPLTALHAQPTRPARPLFRCFRRLW